MKNYPLFPIIHFLTDLPLPLSRGTMFRRYRPVPAEYIPGSEESIPGSERFVPGSERFSPGSRRFSPGSEESIPGSERFSPGSEESSPGSGKFIPLSTNYVPALLSPVFEGRGRSVGKQPRTRLVNYYTVGFIGTCLETRLRRFLWRIIYRIRVPRSGNGFTTLLLWPRPTRPRETSRRTP
jgi:hypothetical protein